MMRDQLKGTRLCSTRLNRWYGVRWKEETVEEECIGRVIFFRFSDNFQMTITTTITVTILTTFFIAIFIKIVTYVAILYYVF